MQLMNDFLKNKFGHIKEIEHILSTSFFVDIDFFGGLNTPLIPNVYSNYTFGP